MSHLPDTSSYTGPNISTPPVLVATASALADMQAQFASQSVLAVDTEADSLYSYYEKVCLLQFSTPDLDYVVDPLAVDVTSLRTMFADPNIQKVFHAAEYDILSMKRDYEFKFENIFDTMIAARVLGWPNIGLGNILQERFGVSLNKKMQRADWGHRPLTDEQVAYAREDTHFLLALRDIQLAELTRLGRLDEAQEEFVRLTRVEPTPRHFDPDGYWNMDGARDLDPTQLGVLRELYRFREHQARHEDRPPFKIAPDSALLAIAHAAPESPRALTRVPGVSGFMAQRHGQAMLAAVGRGRTAPQHTPPRPRSRGDAPLDNPARARLARLKEWRKKRAEERGVAPDVIVSNDVLFAAARHNPRTIEALADVSHIGPWKAREYGAEILAILNGKHK